MEKMEQGNKYSVLMSVYRKENADYLRTAINSIWNQTVPTDDFVLVCDGRLTPELDGVIDGMVQEHAGVIRVVQLEKNSGLGNALNEGIKYCKYEFVARMDSDDISRPDRCEKQLRVLVEQPNVSVVSGIVEEFTESPDVIQARRILPEKQQDIVTFAKKRNPFNHPCVMYRKSAVEKAGGYQDFYLLEDYYLWIRMLQKGFVGYNLQQPLLWMRAGSQLYKRRAGWKYAKSQRALFKYMKKSGFINGSQYVIGVITRSVSSFMPNGMRALIYKKILRKGNEME